MSSFVVHNIPGSPFGRAVLATLEEKGASYRLAPVAPGTLKSEAHLALHPFGRIPVLDHDGFRLYETSAVDRLRWIDLLHGLGFSLHEMRDLLKTWWGAGLGPEAMTRLRAIFLRKLEETREAIRLHQRLEQELSQGGLVVL